MKITKLRIHMMLTFWLIIPLALTYRCIYLPTKWLFLYGWKNTPFIHNVKAGYYYVVGGFIEFWKSGQ